MTIKEFNKRGNDIDKMWKQLWYEIVIKPLKDSGDLR